MKLSMKKLEILKKNIKFRGGLLGLKDFLMILELLLLSYYCSKIKTAERVSTIKERIKTEERIKILKEFDLLKLDPTKGILQLGQQVVSELDALRNFASRYGSRFCIHGGSIYSSYAQTSLNKHIETQIVYICKKGLGYNEVPPHYTGNFMPPTPDLSFTSLDEFANKPVVENIKSDKEVSKVVRKSNDSPTIED
ncbi:hypothetical protein Tco_1071448 [Tanacetum coccineum]